MSGLNYSQCWEDVHLLQRALKIKNDDVVVSISSGGDNSLALLTAKPKKLFLVDKNPAQNYLTELKLKAPQVLPYEQYLELLGVHSSPSRKKYFALVSDRLSPDATAWFSQNMELLESGIIHSGKFERYFNRFRKYLLPLVHSKKTVSDFVNQSNLENQITFYEKKWNTWRWRLFFNLAANASLLRLFARQTGATKEPEAGDSGYLKRLERLIYTNHLRDNHYLCYSLLGQYGQTLPDYLGQNSYQALQNSADEACEFHCQNLLDFLENTATDSVTKFNLSDAFEFLTPGDTIRVWEEIVRTAKPGATVAYWCNRTQSLPPPELRQNVVSETKPKEPDRLYFYRSFHVYTITK